MDTPGHCVASSIATPNSIIMYVFGIKVNAANLICGKKVKIQFDDKEG